MLSLFAFLVFSGGIFGDLGAGGPISENQEAYNCKALDLRIEVFPERKEIKGVAILDLAFWKVPELLELDLVDSLNVTKLSLNGNTLPFEHKNHKLTATLSNFETGTHQVEVHYEGTPWEASRPPWKGGMVWSKNDQGIPWIGVSCQGESGKVYFPCKAHPSDKIEGLRFQIIAPKPLYCAATGILERVESLDNNRRLFVWGTKMPISTYNISFNLANYEIIKDTYNSKGRNLPLTFYVQPQEQHLDTKPKDSRSYSEKKEKILSLLKDYLEVFEHYYGPYPFEQLGIAHTTYLGMEHQTMNAYGNHFKLEPLGFDLILLHELAHEWWGNKVTVSDWADFWIHEGIGTYATMVYIEHRYGLEEAQVYLKGLRAMIFEEKPLIPGKKLRTDQVYSADVYNRGALTLHSLRYLIGRDLLNQILRQYALSTLNTYNKFATTENFITTAERISGKSLGWFFDIYLKEKDLPELLISQTEQQLNLEWKNPGFQMPIEVLLSKGAESKKIKLSMDNGKGSLNLDKDQHFTIDPDQWVLRKN